MTAIAAIQQDGCVWIGGDSAGTNQSWGQGIFKTPKVFYVANMLIGNCGSYRTADLLRQVEPPERLSSVTDDYYYLVRYLLPIVKGWFKDNGHSQIVNNTETFGGNFLIGYRGNIYEVQQDYSILQSADEYLAVGSGESIALGALYATRGQPPEERIRTALEAAARYNAAVRPPFVVHSIGGKPKTPKGKPPKTE